MVKQPIFITGIDTGIGKTVSSATVCTALDADYWKPVQAGDLDASDRIFVQNHASLNLGRIWEEKFQLTRPMAPHKAAELDGISMKLSDFKLPNTANNIVVEGAGGCMVPLNNTHTYLDLIKQLNAQAILVVKNYLGSINHTLLSLAALKNANIPVKGIIISGNANPDSEAAYHAHGNVPVIGHIAWGEKVDTAFIQQQAQNLKPALLKTLL